MSVRGQLSERLGIEETAPAPDERADELLRRKQELALRIRDGDPADPEGALADLDELERDIQAELRLREIDTLADQELADQERARRQAEAERQRDEWTAEKAELEAKRDEQLGKVERALGALIDAIRAALDVDGEVLRVWDLVEPLPPGVSPRRGVRGRIEERLAVRLGEVDMRGLHGVLPRGAGSEPLVPPRRRSGN